MFILVAYCLVGLLQAVVDLLPEWIFCIGNFYALNNYTHYIMKKSLLVFLLLSLMITVSVSAQKLDDQKHTWNHLRLAKSPLQADFKSYSIRIDDSEKSFSSLGIMKTKIPQDFFQFEAYEYKPSEGDFEIFIKLGRDVLIKRELVKKAEKQGKGEDAKTITYYSYEVHYRIPLTYQILDGKRVIMEEGNFIYNRTQKKTFGKERSSAALTSKWYESGNASLNTWVKAKIGSQLRDLSAHILNMHDTRMVGRKIDFYSIKKAEKIGFEDMAAKTEAQLADVIKLASAEHKLTLADFGDLIDTWKTTLQAADASDKKESVAFQAAAWNLGMANALCGNYGDGLTFANKLSEADKRAYLKRNLTSFIDDFVAREKANQNVEHIYHPTFDKESALLNVVPASGPETVVFNTGAEPIEREGYVVLAASKDTIRGFLKYNYRLKNNTEAYTLTSVVVENAANSPSVRTIQPEEILEVREGDELLLPVEAGFGPLSMVVLLREIHTVEGLMLTKYEHNGEDSYYLLHLVKNKKGEKKRKVYGLEDGLMFMNLNSSLAKKFEDCPAIVEKANNKGYKKLETSYLEILEDYNGCAPKFDE